MAQPPLRALSRELTALGVSRGPAHLFTARSQPTDPGGKLPDLILTLTPAPTTAGAQDGEPERRVAVEVELSEKQAPGAYAGIMRRYDTAIRRGDFAALHYIAGTPAIGRVLTTAINQYAPELPHLVDIAGSTITGLDPDRWPAHIRDNRSAAHRPCPR